MGLIKAALGAAGGVMADQWKEFFYCEAIPADVLAVKGKKKATGRSSNTKGDDNIITNGSVIAVANGRPVIMMTAILRSKSGAITGLLCGAVDLLKEDGLFGTVRATRMGSSGYLYLFAPDRTMIIHPDVSRTLQKDIKPGVNRLFDKAIEGFDGSGETINSRGMSFLASFGHLQTTGWILAANYPVEEAYQPITRFRNYFLLGMLFVLLAAIALAWRLGVGIARPLEVFSPNVS